MRPHDPSWTPSSTSRRRSRETGPACFKMATASLGPIDGRRYMKLKKKKRLRKNLCVSRENLFPMRYVNLYVIMKPLQLVRIEQTRTNCIRYRNININISTMFNLYKSVFHIMWYLSLRIYLADITEERDGIPCDIDTYRKIWIVTHTLAKKILTKRIMH